MKTKFQCDICNELYDTDIDAITCENGHAEVIACQYESGNGCIDAVCSILKYEDRTEVSFCWEMNNSRKSQKKFKFDSNVQISVEFIKNDADNAVETVAEDTLE